MMLCAIDPGPSESAYVCWDTFTNGFWPPEPYEKMGIVSTEGMIGRLRLMLMPDLIAIEMVQSYGMTVGRSTFETALNVGRFMQTILYRNPNVPVKLYGRPTIKGQIGGKTDAEIRASLRIRYGEAKKGEKLEGVKKDIWQALALAVALEENPKLREW